jgi:methionyl-tRNA formyltransferase
MGAPDFAVPALEQLLVSRYRVVAVYTSPDKPAGRGRALSYSPVKQVGLKHSVEIRQVQSFKEEIAVTALEQLQPDVIIVASYGLILPPRVLAIPPFGCINLHPSLLPRHRGPTPIPAAILSGDRETGASIMLLDEGVDSGPILAQRRMAIESNDTTGSLTSKLARTSAELLMHTLPRWISGEISPHPQQNEGATYTKLISKTDGEVDWKLPAVELERRVRAFYPWPGCYTQWHGKRLKVIESTPSSGKRGDPGRVLQLGHSDIGVQTGDGILQVQRLQLEGKREMTGEEFIRGQRDFVGSALPS